MLVRCPLAAQAVVLLLLGCRFLLVESQQRVLRGLYAGWIGHGNMGDELVLDVYARLLRRSLQNHLAIANGDSACKDGTGGGGILGCSDGVVVTLEYHEGGIIFVNNREKTNRGLAARDSLNFTHFDFTVLGGGSLLEPVGNFWGVACLSSRAVNIPVYIHGSGTQVAFVADTSYRADALSCVETPAFGGYRGPLTQQLLQDMSADAIQKRPTLRYRNPAQLKIIGDSGLLAGRLFPRLTGPVLEHLEHLHSPSAGVVCLGGLIHLPSMNMSDAIRTWSSKFTVVLLPVDPPTAHAMETVRSMVLKADPALRARVMINRLVTNYGAWLSLLDRCDVILTSRLHAVIMSAAALRPFYVFHESRRSQLKLRDFTLAAFGEELDGFRLSPEFQGSLDEVSAVLEEARTWKVRRYNGTFRAGITKSLALHTDAMMAFWKHLLPEERAKGYTTARIGVRGSLDHAILRVTLES